MTEADRAALRARIETAIVGGDIAYKDMILRQCLAEWAETKSIVIAVCEQLKIHPTEFFGKGRDRRLTMARRLAIKRLQAAGFSDRAIARMIRRNYSSVRYWTCPTERNRRVKKYHAARNAARAGNEGLALLGCAKC